VKDAIISLIYVNGDGNAYQTFVNNNDNKQQHVAHTRRVTEMGGCHGVMTRVSQLLYDFWSSLFCKVIPFDIYFRASSSARAETTINPKPNTTQLVGL